MDKIGQDYTRVDNIKQNLIRQDKNGHIIQDKVRQDRTRQELTRLDENGQN